MLEQNIQIALQAGGIDLEDAIDIRQIKNLKLANQMLKLNNADVLATIDELNQYLLGNVTEKGLQDALKELLAELSN